MSAQFIGCDPGLHGAIAIIYEESVALMDMPLLGSKELDVPKIMQFFYESLPPMSAQPYCIIEKAQTMPKQGIVSAFNYGKAYGMLLACLYMKGIVFKEIPPMTWKKYFGLIRADKDESRRKATQLHPAIDLRYKKDHHKAEAILLADFAKHFFTIGNY